MDYALRLLFCIILFLLFHFSYQAYLRKKNNVFLIKGHDEYVCEHLVVRIYYNCEEQDIEANFEDYETKSTVYLTIFSVKEPTDQEKELEGTANDVGRAVVRCLKDTQKVYQWWYLN